MFYIYNKSIYLYYICVFCILIDINIVFFNRNICNYFLVNIFEEVEL